MTDYTRNKIPVAFPRALVEWTMADDSKVTPSVINDGDTMTYTYKGKDTVYLYNTGKWTGPL